MVKSFLMLGQSNMAGRGFLHDVPPIINERIQMLRNGRWQMMTEPINYDRPVSGAGLAASFAGAWCRENKEDHIGLIPCAEGGSAIEAWNINGTLFRHAVSEAGFAMQSSELTGILWHQGESDSRDGSYESYYRKLLIIVDNLRKELGVPGIPLMIGGLGDFLGKTGYGQGCVEYDRINQELQRFAFDQDHCFFVTAAGLTSNPDGIHMDAASQRKFGLRYFEAFSRQEHILEPLDNEDALITLLHNRLYSESEQIHLISMDLASGKITYEEFEARLGCLTNG